MKLSSIRFDQEKGGLKLSLSSRAKQNSLLCRQFCVVEGPCVPRAKQSFRSLLRVFCVLCTFCIPASSFALNREAFSITNYDLNLQIEPQQHRLGVRGKITLRNDLATPQKIAVLQISSSLNWRSIKAGDKALQYVMQPYTSDIDHTGALSEAIVTLPQEVAPHVAIDLDIAYEGVIVLDATRLTRIDTPEDIAKSSDWDRIDEDFTAIRGAGYVAWYPIATESANISEDESLSEVLTRWKAREVGSRMHLGIVFSRPESWLTSPVVENGTVRPERVEPETLFNAIDCTFEGNGRYEGPLSLDCSSQLARLDAPTLVIARYQALERSDIEVRYLKGHESAAATFADAAEKIVPLITDWFGKQRERAKVAELPIPDEAPFESGALLLTPLTSTNPKSAGLAAAHQLTHAAFLSFRPWIEEGLAHFAQALYLEQQKGRQSALDYMGLHRTALAKIEPTATALGPEQEKSRSLVDTADEELYRSKAMCVWWMLRDMIGDAALKKSIASYKPEQDSDPSYMPRLIAAQTQRDLTWFFDDWVYYDRGLPDFKVEAAYAAKTPTNGFMLTITLDNLGTAGAEVPVIIKSATGEITKRIEVRTKSKVTFRVETAAAPQEIRVNDGSVPESDVTNNIFKMPEPAS